MSAEIIAIFSAMGWAGDSIFVRFGLRRSNIFAAMLMSYVVSITCVWSYLIATTSLEFLRSPAMIYYIISGCLQPIFARALFYEGINRIGVARAGPLRGTEPLFGAAAAVMFLGEQPGIVVFFGTILIVASVWLITGKQEGAKKWRLIDASLPILAALISAISQTLRKQALAIIPDPFVAVAIVTTVSLALMIGFVLTTGRSAQLRMDRHSFFFFFCAAVLATLAQIANFVALGQGQMSAIIPLLNTTPLFTVLLSAIFLRNLETVNARIISGAVLMVAGVILITSRGHA
ncbi:MAG: DMT family transporter [Deltaproteobacteria bacterium]|nr:DMT family transporter [Deltaproteobacteria bacterium]MBM4297161.1 DMT family transporter [Deltaproteobacteria bacterium]